MQGHLQTCCTDCTDRSCCAPLTYKQCSIYEIPWNFLLDIGQILSATRYIKSALHILQFDFGHYNTLLVRKSLGSNLCSCPGSATASEVESEKRTARFNSHPNVRYVAMARTMLGYRKICFRRTSKITSAAVLQASTNEEAIAWVSLPLSFLNACSC